ncbi:MAG: sulfite exporter TauE/SafE family protein [Thermoprotei archaeon]
MVSELLYLLVGFIATLLGSMSGLGGGFLVVPTLYYLGVQPQLVVGSTKFMVFVNSVVSSYRYFRKRVRFPIKLYLFIVIPMMITAYYGAYLAAILPVKQLLLAIGLVLLAGSIRMIVAGSKRRDNPDEKRDKESNRWYLGALSGTLAGLVAGISGLGGGVVNMPMFIYVLRLDPLIAVSLSMAVILPSALVSTTRHVVDGIINWGIAIPLSIGAIIGAFIGPHIAVNIPRTTLRRIIGALILIASIRILLNALT